MHIYCIANAVMRQPVQPDVIMPLDDLDRM
jgi:hypothetical protein